MLTKKQLDDIRSLQQICEETENIELKLNWDTLRSRPADEKHDYFHYNKNGKLLGYLALYSFEARWNYAEWSIRIIDARASSAVCSMKR